MLFYKFSKIPLARVDFLVAFKLGRVLGDLGAKLARYLFYYADKLLRAALAAVLGVNFAPKRCARCPLTALLSGDLA